MIDLILWVMLIIETAHSGFVSPNMTNMILVTIGWLLFSINKKLDNL